LSGYIKQWLLPDKEATSCSVEAESEDFGNSSDFSGEGLREVEEIEFRVRDAITVRRRFNYCKSTRQKFETKYRSSRPSPGSDKQFSINVIFH